MLPNLITTRVISFAEFVDLYQGVALANCRGYFVDAALDVSWSLHKVVDDDAVGHAHHRLLNALDAWFPSQQLPALYIWAIERGDTFGLHSHITLSLSKKLEPSFRVFLDAEIANLVGEPPVQTQRSSTYRLETFASETSMHQWRRFRYLTKALDPNVALTGVPALARVKTLAWIASIDLQIGGEVWSPRVGVAPALAQAQRAQWRRRYPLPDLTIGPGRPPAFDDRFLDWYDANAEVLHLGGPGRRVSATPPTWRTP